jgi:hypothetical protein
MRSMENAESHGNDGLLFAAIGGPPPSPLSNSLKKEFSADDITECLRSRLSTIQTRLVTLI